MARQRGQEVTDKQELFIREYMIDLNITQAAIRAGYPANRAHVTGSGLMKKPEIASRIQRLMDQRNRRLDVKADRVVLELGRIGLSDPIELFDQNNNLLQMRDIPEDLRRCISSVEVEELFEGSGKDREHVGRLHKIKFWDKVKALEILAKYFKLIGDDTSGAKIGVQQNVLINLDFSKMTEPQIEHTLELLRCAQPAPAAVDPDGRGTGAAGPEGRSGALPA